MSEKTILVADVGGTKALLEAGSLRAGCWKPAFAVRYAAADFAGLPDILRVFLREWAAQDGVKHTLDSACFGVAGPALDDRAQMTNLPWFVDGPALGAEFGIAGVRVVNDFAAAASGVELLQATDLVQLQAGEPIARAPRLVIGAGTGLGIAHLFWAGNGYQVVPGEGGHAGFAPATVEQMELWRDLYAQRGRVVVEDLVSGPGLPRIYEFAARSAGAAHSAVTPAAIVERAGAGDPVCQRALDIFIACYGEVAGNLALGALARGGVFIAGGIAPKIIAQLQAGGFLAAFNAKGVYTNELRKIPVAVVTNERLGLLGCALIAQRMAAGAGSM